MPPPPDRNRLRARLAADLAAGKTISLSSAELAHPDVRRQLPQLLEELGDRRAHFGVEVPGYTLLGEIGHGGMSTVHLARQESLGRHVALKIAPKWLGGDERAQQRLLQEARALARVTHPNIVAIHDIVASGDTIAIAMEWIDGLTLAGILNSIQGPPAADDLAIVAAALGSSQAEREKFESTPVRFFVRMLHDIARAVQRVHDAGLLHLDIKPSNVLVRRCGTPLLADFGVVRERDLAATHTRTFAGTPIYSSPEQLRRDDARFGPHSDVYALGMTLYEALARRQPLQSLDLTRILVDVETGRVPALQSIVTVPPDLANIVHKAIAPELQHRYRTAAELADDLLAFLEHRPVTARPLSRWQRLERWTRTQPWKASLAAALLLLLPALVVVGGYLWSQMPRIEAADREEQRRQASELRQAAYFEYFVQGSANGSASNSLRRALELDPTDLTLVCLLAMALEEQDPGLEAVLGKRQEAIRRSTGLRLFAQKIADRRSFFDRGEVEQLLASRNATDKYVLALDRMFLAEDSQHEQDQLDAADRLDEAAISADGDPLLPCLRLWMLCASRATARSAGLAAALACRWPESATVAAWLGACEELVDREGSQPRLRAHIERNPGATWAWEQLMGRMLREQPPRSGDALALAAEAAVRGVQSPRLRSIELIATAMQDGAEAARVALTSMPPTMLNTHRQLQLAEMIDPGQARDLCRQWIAQERPRWRELLEAHHFALASKDLELAKQAWQAARRHFPDRRGLHLGHMQVAWGTGDHATCLSIARECRLPEQHLRNGVIVASLFVRDRAWREAFEFAKQWFERCPESQRAEAASYAGLAAARLGEVPTALAHLATATAGPPPHGKWYAYALTEQAWLLVAPDTPTALRDPALAKARMAAFERHNPTLKQPMQGPWTELIRAEVEFANGNVDNARRLVQRATKFRAAETHAPDDLPKMIEAASARYGR